MPFLILFVIIPLAEIYAFINVGGEIGVPQTLLLCVLTAALGGFIVRKQGLETLINAQKNLSSGEFPLNAIFDGLCIVVAGALLLTPGFVTDILGFSLLFPPFRKIIKLFFVKSGRFKMETPQQRPSHSDDIIIEGEYEEVTKKPKKLD